MRLVHEEVPAFEGSKVAMWEDEITVSIPAGPFCDGCLFLQRDLRQCFKPGRSRFYMLEVTPYGNAGFRFARNGNCIEQYPPPTTMQRAMIGEGE